MAVRVAGRRPAAGLNPRGTSVRESTVEHTPARVMRCTQDSRGVWRGPAEGQPVSIIVILWGETQGAVIFHLGIP